MMEKTALPKRYNLKPLAKPNKHKAPIIRCPECKSKNLKVISRRRYFLKSIASAVVVVPYWILLLNLKEEDIPDPPATILLLGFLILSVLLAVYGLYCFIRAALTRQTSYRCRYFKNKFLNPIYQSRYRGRLNFEDSNSDRGLSNSNSPIY